MGISIEQYRSSIGPHDNFVTTKDILSRFNDHFWSLMFVMFYLNVFYLPVLKQVVGQHKMWNDVMSQMIFYNVYVPLLIRQANDVEENPGPTIFDVIDPTRTICADHSQGNEALFGENAGKQCVAMSLTAIIYHHIGDQRQKIANDQQNVERRGCETNVNIRMKKLLMKKKKKKKKKRWREVRTT